MNNITPLQYAVGYGSVDSVRVLVRNGADFTISTKAGISMQSLANARKSNDIRTSAVKRLLGQVFEAYGTATSDYEVKKMKESYVDEVSDSKQLLGEKDLLNFVYTKTYRALQEGKKTTEVLSAEGERAKKIGKKDAKDKKVEDENYTKEENQPNKIIREAYKRGYQLGKAELQGEIDGSEKVAKPRGSYVNMTDDKELRAAYINAFNRAKGKFVQRGFEDGIRGKKEDPPTEGGIGSFDPQISKILKLGMPNPEIVRDYEFGHMIGRRKLYTHLANIVGSAKADGMIDGNRGNEMYTTTFKIEEYPLLGASKTDAGEYDPNTALFEKKDKQVYEVNYGDLDVGKGYSPIPGVTLMDNVEGENIASRVNLPDGTIKYGAYIQILYKFGYGEGSRGREVKGGKTYRRKIVSKTKTYKKKLSKK